LPWKLRERIDRQAPHEALEEAWKVIRAANSYIDRQAPWALKKTDPPRMAEVLRLLVDVLRPVATVLQPFMPGSMAKMLDQLGVPADQRRFDALKTPLPDGISLPAPQGVFPRWVEETSAKT
jgi:methionyl-tRNA synthetase